jgi:hypothetical protein
VKKFNTKVAMFEWLKEFKRILVTGPQRSGTRIGARMMAYDTGYRFVDEMEVKFDSLYALSDLFAEHQEFVVQCPALCCHAHLFSADDTAVVLMRRKIPDIVASQERIHWVWEKTELARYGRISGNIAEIKYEFWEQYQRSRIIHAFEIPYENLEAHPLWVSLDQRKDFRPGQTMALYNLDMNVRPYPQPGCMIVVDKSEQAILIRTEGTPKVLNTTAQLVWHFCNGQHTIRAIVQALTGYFNGVEENTLMLDVSQVIGQLVKHNFLGLSAPEKYD